MLQILELVLWFIACALTFHWVPNTTAALIIISVFGAAGLMVYADPIRFCLMGVRRDKPFGFTLEWLGL